MPLFASFNAMAARGLGITSGIAPGAPVITGITPGATSLTVFFTPITGSYQIDYFQYSLNGGSYTGPISGSSTDFTISGLSASTTYSVAIRAIDVTGQVGAASDSVSSTTTAEIANSAPSVTLSQLESTGTPINATKLSWSFAASTGGTYAVDYYQYRLYRGPSELTSGWTTTPMGPSSTYELTGLNPNTQHTIQVRAISATSGLSGLAGSATAWTDAEIPNSQPTSVTVDSVTTTNVTFSRGTSSGGTYAVASYEWRILNTSLVVVSSGTMTTAETSKTVTAGVSPDQYFYVEVRAISATSGTAGSYFTSSPGRLNPGVPSVGTLSWSGSMTNSSWGTASLYMTIPTYATSATLVVSGVGSYAATSSGGNFTWSIGSLQHNQTYTFYAYVTNRISENSTNSNTRTWVTPKKNQVYQVVPNGYGDRFLAATNSSLSGCSPSSEIASFGYIPSSDNEVGYINITTVGVQIKSGGFSNTVTEYLYFEWPGGSTKNYGASSALNDNTGSTYSLRAQSISVGGSTLSGGQIKLTFEWVDGAPAGSAARIAEGGFGCLPNGSNYFLVRGFYVEGVQTTAGSLA